MDIGSVKYIFIGICYVLTTKKITKIGCRMEFALGIFILLALGFYVTIQATRISSINQALVEQRRREYRYVLNIARNHPQRTNYHQLVYACGQAYAAVEDPTIFDVSMLADDLRSITAEPNSPLSYGTPPTQRHIPSDHSIPTNH